MSHSERPKSPLDPKKVHAHFDVQRVPLPRQKEGAQDREYERMAKHLPFAWLEGHTRRRKDLECVERPEKGATLSRTEFIKGESVSASAHVGSDVLIPHGEVHGVRQYSVQNDTFSHFLGQVQLGRDGSLWVPFHFDDYVGMGGKSVTHLAPDGKPLPYPVRVGYASDSLQVNARDVWMMHCPEVHKQGVFDPFEQNGDTAGIIVGSLHTVTSGEYPAVLYRAYSLFPHDVLSDFQLLDDDSVMARMRSKGMAREDSGEVFSLASNGRVSCFSVPVPDGRFLVKFSRAGHMMVHADSDASSVFVHGSEWRDRPMSAREYFAPEGSYMTPLVLLSDGGFLMKSFEKNDSKAYSLVEQGEICYVSPEGAVTQLLHPFTGVELWSPYNITESAPGVLSFSADALLHVFPSREEGLSSSVGRDMPTDRTSRRVF